MSSIMTNNSAMVALATLRNINSNMAETQSQISTGKSVATAKDNAAVWAISKTMEADVQGFNGVSDALALGSSTVAVARSAAETVTELLTEMKEKIVSAQGENVDHAKIQADIAGYAAQIDGVVKAAQFNGLNLVENGSTDTTVLSSMDRAAGVVTASSIDVVAADLSAATLGVDAAGIDVTAGGTQAHLTSVEAAIATTIDAAAAFGSVQGRIDIQSEYISSLTDSMRSGIGSLVDADMEETSARLQALQVQQQLGIQALSIANQAPQNILSLFR
ncbi:flagellin [Pararhodobacter oceanensis]|uniref:Flagellin n=1 Tax=Pararhodobacter oceanensis TaxID=2172121 RepID=A0A2T8HSV5_9RHOB|nr:flagellin [Pararhodobacter oceanensis]PVH28506.1 flagellin [Pararhodobacter oceanensis]